jgi:hypothetical protein
MSVGSRGEWRGASCRVPRIATTRRPRHSLTLASLLLSLSTPSGRGRLRGGFRRRAGGLGGSPGHRRLRVTRTSPLATASPPPPALHRCRLRRAQPWRCVTLPLALSELRILLRELYPHTVCPTMKCRERFCKCDTPDGTAAKRTSPLLRLHICRPPAPVTLLLPTSAPSHSTAPSLPRCRHMQKARDSQ